MIPPESSHPELHGLDPGELLARGINTAHPSGPVHEWTPPTPEELGRILPQYRIESLIGRGGMGAVYKGSQQKLGRSVAIKLLPVELTADTQFVIRFEREARTLAQLHHPGIVSIYDFGQTSDGHLYFVMEYVEGTDLRRVLQGPGLEPAQALELTTQICEALHAAHEKGVVHRDIKPANILITADGRVKLADFGLARPGNEEHEPLTQTHAVLGTPDYMAPEQREGQADLRTDIYALGLMLYEMLTGQLPRGAWTPPSRKVQVDVRIDEVVIKALQEEPDRRYQQASEMKTDVESIRSGVSLPPLPRRNMFRGIFAAAIVTAGLAAAGLWFYKLGGPGQTANLSSKQPPALTGSLVGGIEKPIKGNTSLRRIVFPDEDNGLFKQIFLPSDPDAGLLVRLRCAADFMTDEERAKGYDINTLWEWVQVPPAGGTGENMVRLTQGTPAWSQKVAGVDLETIRLVSGMTFGEELDFEDGELFSTDGVAISSEIFKPTPEGIEYTYTRKVGDKQDVFLQFQILAVPHQELKARFPSLRGPRETTGEVAMWIDEPAPNEISSSQTLSPDSSADGSSPEIRAPVDSGMQEKTVHQSGGGALIKVTSSPWDQYGLSQTIYTPTRKDLGLVVRYTASPAFMMAMRFGEVYEKDSISEWAFKPNSKEDLQIPVMEGWPLWHEGASDENGDGSYMLRVGEGGSLLSIEKFPSLDSESEPQMDAEGNVIGYTLTFQRFRNNTITSADDKGETWLKVEITALPVEEIENRYPLLKSPGRTGAPTVRIINGEGDSDLAAHEDTPPPSQTNPPPPPDPGKIFRDDAYAAALRGDALQSKAFTEKAIALDPDLVWNWVASGWCLFNLDLHTEALAAWQKAYELNPEGYSNIHVCLALAFDQAGDEKEALRHYSEQVKLDPAFGQWDSLLKATGHWKTTKEKAALHSLYSKWSGVQTLKEPANFPSTKIP